MLNKSTTVCSALFKRNLNSVRNLFWNNYHCPRTHQDGSRSIHNHNRHVFALNYQNLSDMMFNVEPNEIIGIDDGNLVRRMNTVLRSKPGDQFVLFDTNSNYQLFEIIKIENRMINAKVLLTLDQQETTQLLNQRRLFSITASICMTKSRDTFEEMIYTCSSMGVNTIIPIMTEKKQHAEYFENKRDRLEKIMIAAVEQSKQFYGMPQIIQPMSIQDYCKYLSATKKEQLLSGNNNVSIEQPIKERRIFLDVDGEKSWLSLLNEIEDHKRNKQQMNINLLVGPERDLFDQERSQLLTELGFESISLARKIVYKSEVALSVSLGGITSVIWNK